MGVDLFSSAAVLRDAAAGGCIAFAIRSPPERQHNQNLPKLIAISEPGKPVRFDPAEQVVKGGQGNVFRIVHEMALRDVPVRDGNQTLQAP
jgi:hypothetical protein